MSSNAALPPLSWIYMSGPDTLLNDDNLPIDLPPPALWSNFAELYLSSYSGYMEDWGVDVASITGTLNGQNIDFYLQGCVIHVPTGTVQSVVCPDTHLTLMPGINNMNIDLHLIDQNTLSTTVQWDIQ